MSSPCSFWLTLTVTPKEYGGSLFLVDRKDLDLTFVVERFASHFTEINYRKLQTNYYTQRNNYTWKLKRKRNKCESVTSINQTCKHGGHTAYLRRRERTLPQSYCILCAVLPLEFFHLFQPICRCIRGISIRFLDQSSPRHCQLSCWWSCCLNHLLTESSAHRGSASVCLR